MKNKIILIFAVFFIFFIYGGIGGSGEVTTTSAGSEIKSSNDYNNYNNLNNLKIYLNNKTGTPHRVFGRETKILGFEEIRELKGIKENLKEIEFEEEWVYKGIEEWIKKLSRYKLKQNIKRETAEKLSYDAECWHREVIDFLSNCYYWEICPNGISDLEKLVERRTEQLKKAQDSLKESESRFRAVFEHMSMRKLSLKPLLILDRLFFGGYIFIDRYNFPTGQLITIDCPPGCNSFISI